MKHLILFFVAILLFSCQKQTATPADYGNPPAQGFNESRSDDKAIALADDVMETMGGRRAWDNTRYIKWTFFGNRTHTWDKQGQRNRIDIPKDSLTIVHNLTDQTGHIYKNGAEITDTSQLPLSIADAHAMWINDSYWLVMPFKLKDSGVTLTYTGRDTTVDGRNAEVVSLVFDNVGVTPQNKYLVYVDDASGLVSQWDYYPNATDSLPAFQSPWPEYKQYGEILLSGGAIRGMRMTDIEVMDDVPANTFLDL